MMPRTLCEVQEAVLAERRRQNWASATDIHCTVPYLAEECGEFARALRKKDEANAVGELADIMLGCLGGLYLLDVRGDEVLRLLDEVVTRNLSRPLRPGH
jgi:NTP pyrophosphatase (non-canonical NTP hydrolase)